MPKVTIAVTQEHINKATFFKGRGAIPSRSCPIALAVQEKWPNARVGLMSIAMDDNDNDSSCIYLPVAARRFVCQFDFGQAPVEPFSFEVDVPE